MLKQTESGILGIKADFRTRARNIQGDPGALCIGGRMSKENMTQIEELPMVQARTT